VFYEGPPCWNGDLYIQQPMCISQVAGATVLIGICSEITPAGIGPNAAGFDTDLDTRGRLYQFEKAVQDTSLVSSPQDMRIHQEHPANRMREQRSQIGRIPRVLFHSRLQYEVVELT